MGIEHFNSYISKILNIKQDMIDKDNVYAVLVDLNPLAYKLFDLIAARSIKKEEDGEGEVYEFNGNDELYNSIYRSSITKVITDFAELIDKHRPHILGIFSDGVPVQGKMWQQKERRYKSRCIYCMEKLMFSTTEICPGSDFQKSFRTEVEKILKILISKPEKVIFSFDDVPGEGEHKLVHFIRYLPDTEKPIIVYGNDSDLVVITSTIPGKNIFILKENQRTQTRGDVKVSETIISYLSIEIYKKKINDKMKNIHSISSAIDFMIMLNFIGNDFLPKVHCMFELNKSIDQLISFYDPDNRLHYIENIGGKDLYRLDLRNLAMFLYKLGTREIEILRVCNPQSDIMRACTKFNGTDIIIDKNLIMNKYYSHVGKFYTESLDELSALPDKMALNYIRTIQWTFNYYLDYEEHEKLRGVYLYSHPPLIVSIAHAMRDYRKEYNSYQKPLEYYDKLWKKHDPLNDPSFLMSIIMMKKHLKIKGTQRSLVHRKNTVFNYIHPDAPLEDPVFKSRFDKPLSILPKICLKKVSIEFTYLMNFFEMELYEDEAESSKFILEDNEYEEVSYRKFLKPLPGAQREKVSEKIVHTNAKLM